MNRLRVILIGGPTASGKSAFAMEVARRERGAIINADAMQLYSGLSILTAQPRDDERLEIPHRLYGDFDPATHSSVARWLGEAQRAIGESHDAGLVPVLVGGTGLYFRALEQGLADIPDIPGSVRASAQALYDELGEALFRTLLCENDPESAQKIARNDRHRLVRAYEVAHHTGKCLGHWQRLSRETISPRFSFERHLLLPTRERLYAACDARFLDMIDRGAVEEARAFLSRGLDSGLPTMKTIGLREIRCFLRLECSLDAAILKAQQATRNYAKRQTTWFRNQWTHFVQACERA
ncbi:MAG: tRNA (adenosine(37)-N6)-dimethylallyltransferase MiaA [Bdellovibrionales bacterium]